MPTLERTKKNRSVSLHLVSSRGGKIIDYNEMGLVTDKFTVKCINDHLFKTTIDTIKSGSWCKECSTGLYERICRAYFEIIFDKRFPNTRGLSWLVSASGTKLELDGYCEELGIAFEHQGDQHYIDDAFYPPSRYDKDKTKLCKKNNVLLIKIPSLVTRTKLRDLPKFLHRKLEKIGYEIDLDEIEKIDFTSAYKFSEKDEMVARGDRENFDLLSKNAVISSDRYLWRCRGCGVQIERNIYQIERQGCQRCFGLKKVGEVNGNTNIHSYTQLADEYYLDVQTVMRLNRKGLNGQDIVNLLLGNVREVPNFRLNEKSIYFKNRWFKSQTELCKFYDVKFKSVGNYTYRYGLEFTDALNKFLKNKCSTYNIEGKEFRTKEEVYKSFNISEDRINKYLRENDNCKFEESVKLLAIEFRGRYYKNNQELLKEYGVSYALIANRVRRSDKRTSYAAELQKFLTDKSKPD